MNKLITKKISIWMLCLLVLSGCHQFMVKGWLSGFGYDADECEKRDWTHHSSYYPNGTIPGRYNIHARRYRCRIERVCIGKSKEENVKCKIDAGNYWSFTEDNHFYQVVKHDDDESDAICALKPSSCSSKWHSQENYSTNPYWNKETKSYILPKNPNK